jgi:two-component system cell cycle sensor histidine kinase PleC
MAGGSMRRAVDLARRWLSACTAAGVQCHFAAGAQPAVHELAADPAAAAPNLSAHRIAPVQHPFGDLLACMSHELRTPLNAVIGFSDLMQRELFGPLGDARYQEYVRHIRDSGDALLRAAEDTLVMTTLVASASHAASEHLGLLATLIGAWNELAAHTAGLDVGLELEVAPDIEIRANARAMRQALKHLLAAGLARARPGGQLRVAAATAHGRVRIEISVPGLDASALESTAARTAGGEDLALCLARTLFEVQGSTLTEEWRNRGWKARTEVEHAVQEDFFARAS